MNEKDFRSVPISSSEITPEHIYLNRRNFLKGLGVASATALLAACGVKQQPTSTGSIGSGTARPSAVASGGGKTDELGDPANAYDEITNYNNYYEFTEVKEDVAGLSKNFKTSPWTIEVGGLVAKPKTFGLDEILKLAPQEERIYRLRCVEAWSMVIPWMGFPLSALLKMVEPLSNAKFVGFTTVMKEDEMPGLSAPFYPWPYTEGLRMDEAMNDLAILATGLYGKPLPAQDGAPIRLVVPWKYGFKSIKAIVKIDLLENQPKTFWSTIAPDEYGFYSNVNPNVPHPRWSQSTERRIGETSRRKTLLFNGYANQVASLYANMDLKVDY